MHLSECLFASADNFQEASSSTSDCMSAWLLKSTTAFYGMQLNLPWFFGLFCFNYSIAGMVMLVTKPKWIQYSNFPYTAFALYLIFVQGPLSFLADYQNMSEDSYFHVIDRWSASSSLCLELSKIALMVYHRVRPVTAGLYAAAAVFAVYSFLQSQTSQVIVDRDGFVYWHNMWHLYPLIGSVIISFDFFVLGDCHEQEGSATSTSSTKTRPVPLSTLIMRQLSFLTDRNNNNSFEKKITIESKLH